MAARKKQSDALASALDEAKWEDVEYPVTALKSAGDEIVGRYLGFRYAKVRNKQGVLEARQLHLFEKMDGERTECWGSTHMDRVLAQSELGRLTRVERTDEKLGKDQQMIRYITQQQGSSDPSGVTGRPEVEPVIEE